eukprot:769590_1
MADKLTTAVIFKTKDGSNILQPSNPSNNDYLSYITNINSRIYSSPYGEYYNLCYADSDSFPDCSSAAIFDPIRTAFGDDPNNVTQHDIDQWIAATTNVYGTQFYSVFASSFATSERKESQYYRAFFYFGLPYPDINQNTSSYSSQTDKYLEQKQRFIDYMWPIFEDIVIDNTHSHPNIE